MNKQELQRLLKTPDIIRHVYVWTSLSDDDGLYVETSKAALLRSIQDYGTNDAQLNATTSIKSDLFIN